MKKTGWLRQGLAVILVCLVYLSVPAVSAAEENQVTNTKGTIAASVVNTALSYRGVPYVWGGSSPRGFDCSGFVMHVYQKNGIKLPRTADAQFAFGRKLNSAEVRPGDVVFFQTYTYGASHCGIYLGQGQFVHASSSKGVMVSRLSENYWRIRYLGARRMM